MPPQSKYDCWLLQSLLSLLHLSTNQNIQLNHLLLIRTKWTEEMEFLCSFHTGPLLKKIHPGTGTAVYDKLFWCYVFSVVLGHRIRYNYLLWRLSRYASTTLPSCSALCPPSASSTPGRGSSSCCRPPATSHSSGWSVASCDNMSCHVM